MSLQRGLLYVRVALEQGKHLFFVLSSGAGIVLGSVGSGIMPSCHHAIMPSCHHAIMPSCHHAIMPSCHHAIMPSCHHAIMPSCHHAIMPSCHHAIMPSCHLGEKSTYYTYINVLYAIRRGVVTYLPPQPPPQCWQSTCTLYFLYFCTF